MADIEIHGLDELMKRMAAFPEKMAEVTRATMEAAILAVWGEVPPYPAPPENSTYDRTGTLGRTLGSGSGGGKGSNQPSIYEVHEIGSAGFEGRFGTNLDYAPFVIGDETQAGIHQGRWWVMKDLATKAHDKVVGLFNKMGSVLAGWLEGQGL